ncbi:hypothetical protein EIP91_009927 [Steccherinum ochraceum]|uniref:Peptidase A1 domain-containing protein n=1 Tax=Steccherinum ochraceum TaxID=92696 RepID=A0A4R0R137_9APHY|nr:hypothetical protein EIP91_009927 [Steccherinum ochraceum]
MGNEPLHLTMSTSTGVTYVASPVCPDCAGPLYDPHASQTAIDFDQQALQIDYLGVSAPVVMVKENCSLPTSDGSLWVYPNQTLAVLSVEPPSPLNAASGANVGRDGVAGLVGLGLNLNSPGVVSADSTYNPTFDDSIFGQFFLLHPDAANFTFGVELEAPRSVMSGEPAQAAGSDAGTVNWLQVDTSSYDPSTLSWQWVNNQLPMQSATNTTDWIIPLNGWKIHSLSSDADHTNFTTVASNLDPMYQGIYLPLDVATEILALETNCSSDSIIPQAAVTQPHASTLSTLAQSWTVPCDSDFTFSIFVEQKEYILDESSLVTPRSDGTCVSGIEGWVDPTVTQYLLGARFMSAFYIIFSVQQDGTSLVGFADKTKPTVHHRNLGAIIGGSVGGGVFLFVIAAGFFIFYRRRNRRRASEADNAPLTASSGVITYSLPTSQSASPTPGSPILHPITVMNTVVPNLAVRRQMTQTMSGYSSISKKPSFYNDASSVSAHETAFDTSVPDDPPYFRVIARRESPTPGQQSSTGGYSGNSPYMTSTGTGSQTSLVGTQGRSSHLRSSTVSPDQSPRTAPTQLATVQESKGKERESVPPAYSPTGLSSGAWLKPEKGQRFTTND